MTDNIAHFNNQPNVKIIQKSKHNDNKNDIINYTKPFPSNRLQFVNNNHEQQARQDSQIPYNNQFQNQQQIPQFVRNKAHSQHDNQILTSRPQSAKFFDNKENIEQRQNTPSKDNKDFYQMKRQNNIQIKQVVQQQIEPCLSQQLLNMKTQFIQQIPHHQIKSHQTSQNIIPTYQLQNDSINQLKQEIQKMVNEQLKSNNIEVEYKIQQIQNEFQKLSSKQRTSDIINSDMTLTFANFQLLDQKFLKLEDKLEQQCIKQLKQIEQQIQQITKKEDQLQQDQNKKLNNKIQSINSKHQESPFRFQETLNKILIDIHQFKEYVGNLEVDVKLELQKINAVLLSDIKNINKKFDNINTQSSANTQAARSIFSKKYSNNSENINSESLISPNFNSTPLDYNHLVFKQLDLDQPVNFNCKNNDISLDELQAFDLKSNNHNPHIINQQIEHKPRSKSSTHSNSNETNRYISNSNKNSEQKSLKSDQELIYQIDEHGHLLDGSGKFLLDQQGNKILLTVEQINMLRQRNLIEE